MHACTTGSLKWQTTQRGSNLAVTIQARLAAISHQPQLRSPRATHGKHGGSQRAVAALPPAEAPESVHGMTAGVGDWTVAREAICF